jgi:hypothetical protein
MPGEQLLLINPRRKRRVKKAHRRRAKNSRRRTRRAAGGFAIRRRRVKNPRSHKRRSHKRHRNPIMRKRYRRRARNPVSISGLKGALIPALFGAAGGVAVDYGYNALAPMLPTAVTGALGSYTAPVIKIASAFGIGLVARKFLGRDKGNAVMAGALAIQAYNLIAVVMGGTAGMAGFGRIGAYMPSAAMAGLGSPNPAGYLQKPLGRMGRVGAYIKSGTMGGLPFAGTKGMGVITDMDMFDN